MNPISQQDISEAWQAYKDYRKYFIAFEIDYAEGAK